MDIEIPREQFLKDAFEKINQKVISGLHYHGLSNYRGNVIELPLATIRGCHYEIGFHTDCYEIALHFQGTAQNNLFRSEGFRPYLPDLEEKLAYPLILGQHEGGGRKRLWIRLPINPLTPELLEQHTDLMARLIILTLPLLQAIIRQEESK